MPEQLLQKLKKSILPQYKIAFISAFIVGLIAHMYKITNWLPNWDSLVFRYGAQNMLQIGRWFLNVACAPSTYYDLPWATGLLAILYLSLGAMCIARMFQVKQSVTAILIGALVASFPTVTSVLMYHYVADGYMLAFLFSVLAAMLLVSDKPRYVASVVLMALSAGIYQAYITVTVMLLLAYLVKETVWSEQKAQTLLLKALKFLASGAAGMGLYYLVLQALLKVTGTVLLEYQGIQETASMGGLNLWESLYTIKQTFVGYFFDFSNGWNVFSILNVLILLASIVLYVISAYKNKIGIVKVVFLAVCAALIPIGACVLALINSTVDYHNLMKMGFLVCYLFLILQYETADFGKEQINAAKKWLVLGLVTLLTLNHIMIANVSYHALGMAYEKSYAMLVRIADRIEQTEGAEECDRILVLGALEDSDAYSVVLPPDMTGTTNGYIVRADDEVAGQSVLCSALNDYCGTQYEFVAGKEKEALLTKIDLEQINIWPSADCIMVVDDVIVLRLSE